MTEPADEVGSIAFVEEWPGANTQGETLEDVGEHLGESICGVIQY